MLELESLAVMANETAEPAVLMPGRAVMTNWEAVPGVMVTDAVPVTNAPAMEALRVAMPPLRPVKFAL